MAANYHQVVIVVNVHLIVIFI